MTKAIKELIVVFVIGAGALTLLWGLLHQINTSIIPGQSNLISQIMWTAVWWGCGLIVFGAAIGLLLKPSR